MLAIYIVCFIIFFFNLFLRLYKEKTVVMCFLLF